jgi:hypothetical protein
VWAGQPATYLMMRKAYDEKQQQLKHKLGTGGN